MKTNRLSSLLLSVALLMTMMLAVSQTPATSASPIRASRFGPGALTKNYRTISTFAIPDPRNVFKASRAEDKCVLWKVHLALQLVQHPELNQLQVRIVLDAISLSTPEFFATANKSKADEALLGLTRRALATFPREQVGQLFANFAGDKAEEDILKMYYDLSALSLRKRRAAFKNAEPNYKSKLWKTHLALSFVKQELTGWQQEIVLSAMSLATPEYFRLRSNDPEWEVKVRQPSSWLEQQVLNAFSLDDARKMFATLGDDGESAKSSAIVLLKNIRYKPLSSSGPYKQWAHSRTSLQDMELESSACQCSLQSDYCPIWSACVSSNCNQSQDGCGFMWGQPCNGACR